MDTEMADIPPAEAEAKADGEHTDAERPSAEPEAAAQAPAEDPRRRWYVIHTYSGYENKVKTNL